MDKTFWKLDKCLGVNHLVYTERFIVKRNKQVRQFA